ncbi:MAG: hypothetical protein EXX96DRAFT_557957 [Benjaminiella poitrasii]|nr:MAG: hypothetical protein EXX96DRAFT_557957 [Benjaminiella poitrasii]
METNMYNGVRAEPKFLRDPTSLESISSGISRLSSYVTSNLQKRKSSLIMSPFDPQYQQPRVTEEVMTQPDIPDNEEDDNMDKVTFAVFENFQDKRWMKIPCLLLGYQDGFQIWDITNPDNVHEILSVRDKDTFHNVSFIHVLKTDGQQQQQQQQGPILAIISEVTKCHTEEGNHEDTTIPNTKASKLIIYSLKSQAIIKEIHKFGDEDDDTTVVTCIKSNHKVIVLGCVSRQRSLLHFLSIHDYEPFASPLTDVYHDQQSPIFALGSRFIAYATNAAVLNSDPVMTTNYYSPSTSHYHKAGLNVFQGDKDVKGAAKGIAKEVVSSMKTLGEFGFNTLSNYFNPQQQQQQSVQQSLPQQLYYNSNSPNNRRYSSSGASPRQHQEYIYNSYAPPQAFNQNNASAKKMIPSGMIMIRDILKLPKSPTRNLSISTIAHFRPHSHPISCLQFNQAGTLLMSASKQGHTFHIFSILTPSNVNSTNVSHLYSLSRGITDAQVEDCQFSIDSNWCAISTARGTTHVYAINPYGGKPEIAGHVQGKVNNHPILFHPYLFKNKPTKLVKATQLNSVVRIKQRRKMSGSNLTTPLQDDLMMNNNKQQPFNVGYHPNGAPHYFATNTLSRAPREPLPRAKLTTMFVTVTKSPYYYLINNSNSQSPHHSNNTSSTSLDGIMTNYQPLVGTIRQQATQMLSSFGSSMSNNLLSSGSQQGTASNTKVQSNLNNGSANNDNALMFGFDEEYDDATTKMMNDGEDIGYQDLYSFHPDGILTLHRCWITKTVIKKREKGRNVEKLDLSVKEEDVAEWRVARSSDWEEVKWTVPTPDAILQPTTTTSQKEESPTHKKRQKKSPVVPKEENQDTSHTQKKKKVVWLSNAEIATYGIALAEDPPLWTRHQFSFQTYQAHQDLKSLLDADVIPNTNTMILLKGMPEPVSSRIDRVSKTTTRIANHHVEENIDDAIAELEDNISKAMQTSFSPSSHQSLDISPATKWLSSSGANNNNGSSSSPSSVSTTHKSLSFSPYYIDGSNTVNRNSSVSFEDAYLIHMGSGPNPEPAMLGIIPQQDDLMQHSSLIQFDDDDEQEEEEEEEEAIMQQERSDVYSPDGDNEVAYPYESIFGDFHSRPLNNNNNDDDNVVASW